MVVPPIDEPLRLGALGWVMHRPLTGVVFLVFGIAALRMIWDRMPDALPDFKPALLLSGAVALMATVMACVIGGEFEFHSSQAKSDCLSPKRNNPARQWKYYNRFLRQIRRYIVAASSCDRGRDVEV